MSQALASQVAQPAPAPAASKQILARRLYFDLVGMPPSPDEMAAFLGDSTAVFGQAQMQALHDIRTRMGLDYCGIDCGLDRDGNVVVFEVNASMLVHARNEGFLYKTPAVERIKSAYDAMLRKLVKSG